MTRIGAAGIQGEGLANGCAGEEHRGHIQTVRADDIDRVGAGEASAEGSGK